MTSPLLDRTRVPGYRLDMPTEADAVAALRRVFGPERGDSLWADACHLVGVVPGTVRTPGELERVTQALAQAPGAPAAVARSIEIRMRTHAQLAAGAVAARAGAQR